MRAPDFVAPGAREHLGVSVEVVCFDSDLVEFEVMASNGRFSGVVDLYDEERGPARLAEAIRGFPRSPEDRREADTRLPRASPAEGMTVRGTPLVQRLQPRRAIATWHDDRMETISVTHFRTHAYEFTRRASRGEAFLILRRGRPIGRLLAPPAGVVEVEKRRRRPRRR